jgi:glycosyltransferase involved in cell wall biosynthesis
LPPYLSIVLPAHNEEERLPDSLNRIQAFLAAQPWASEVVVVENGSQDQTAQVAEVFARRHANVRLLREAHPGKGRAVRRGILAALGEYRFICDVDLSMPIEQVARFLPPAQADAAIVIASREAPGAVRYNEPAHRHWIGRGFNLLVRLLAVPGLQDTQCGFKCFRADAAEELFRLQVLNGWTFDVEVLFLARRRGYRIIEIPIPWTHIPGSRVRLARDSFAMLADLLRIRWYAARGRYGPSR